MNSLVLPRELVSVEWLHKQLGHRDLVVLDASFFMPGVARDGKQEWQKTRIPTAQYFDFDGEICDQNSDLPHMMPSESDFQDSVQQLGINQKSVIVVYDSLGIFSSPRVWWMFKAMGCEQVAVLDGGLPAWIEKELSIECGEPLAQRGIGDFIARYQQALIYDANNVLLATQSKDQAIIDARSQARFLAQEEEPREGVRAGHMPNAKNLPFSEILSDQKMQDAYQLALIFEAIAPKHNRLVFSCGSGVTACILALAATLAGYKNLSVYDGSWTEWGAREDLPVVQVTDGY